MKPTRGSHQGVTRSFFEVSSDIDPRRDKILIIGSGLLTALILLTLYLLTRHIVTALTPLPGSAPFVVEIRNDPIQRVSCADQPLIVPSEMRGSAGEPIILKLTPPSGEPRMRTSLLKLQLPHHAATLSVSLTVYKGQQTVQSLCSRCHSVEVQTINSSTFVVDRFTEAEAGLNTQDQLEVTY